MLVVTMLEGDRVRLINERDKEMMIQSAPCGYRSCLSRNKFVVVLTAAWSKS